MNADDPRLTAYALGELPGDERVEIEHLLAQSPEARRFVEETRTVSDLLKAEYAAPASPEEIGPANLIDIRDDPWFWSRARPLAVAALIAVGALVGAIIFGTYQVRHGSNDPAGTQLDYAAVETDAPRTGVREDPGSRGVLNPVPVEAIGRYRSRCHWRNCQRPRFQRWRNSGN